MRRWLTAFPAAVLVFVLVLSSCQDSPAPLSPPDSADAPVMSASRHAAQDVQAWLARSAPEVLALPRTVFGAHDPATNQIVFGVENVGVMTGVHSVMRGLGVPTSAYRLEVAEPIYALATLRDRNRPTFGGVQIHFGQFLCTLGFNVDHSGGESFITNSHCTEKQGGTEGTLYYQPTSSVDGTAIATEADDPTYFKGGECSRGKVCRYSDAARAAYHSPDRDWQRGVIGKTTGENTGSINLDGSFTVASQDNGNTHFSGTLHKVGRTTGWTSGGATNTCVRVNVSGSNVQLLCQTLVQRSGRTIVGAGDSGSPVFRITSGDNVDLVGILWGGNSSGDLFVFSPLKNIQDELGGLTATADGSGGGTGDGGGDNGGGDDDDGGGDCIPRGPNGNNCK